MREHSWKFAILGLVLPHYVVGYCLGVFNHTYADSPWVVASGLFIGVAGTCVGWMIGFWLARRGT